MAGKPDGFSRNAQKKKKQNAQKSKKMDSVILRLTVLVVGQVTRFLKKPKKITKNFKQTKVSKKFFKKLLTNQIIYDIVTMVNKKDQIKKQEKDAMIQIETQDQKEKVGVRIVAENVTFDELLAVKRAVKQLQNDMLDLLSGDADE